MQILQTILGLILIFLVLLHSIKGEGLGSIGGQYQAFKSINNPEKGLNLITWLVAGLFLLVSAVLGWEIV